MTDIRRLIASGLVLATMLGLTASPANAQTQETDPTTCAYVAEVSVVMDGQTEAKGFDSSRGDLTPEPSRTTDGCEAADQGGHAPQDDFGSKVFTSKAPTYHKSDTNSTFDAQTNFVAGLPTAFGFKVSQALIKVAISPVSVANATRTPPNCSYNKPGVSVDYLFHWSCSKQEAEVDYRFTGKWVFRVNIGGQTGTATISWKFDYIIYTRIG
ncbi:hypothetical protein GCM10029976_020530 [Kribbella albertanoniae]|uniref:Uncharacterized protein n=1 Tax=Kribbella albertanoniae TaxID=1266829 RepID=A0A4R4P3I6_9ACTN|nr:hypothetical protein [Kribbella albertanoniae]TDC16908.1 hypothetical protein E1261_38040 [Kribbella albertanoniae]